MHIVAPPENLTQNPRYQSVPLGTLPPPILVPVPKHHFSRGLQPSFLAASLQVRKCCWAPRHTPHEAAARGWGQRKPLKGLCRLGEETRAAVLSWPSSGVPSSPRSSDFLTTKCAAVAMARAWLSLCLGPIAPNPPFQCIYFPVPGQGL